jgi:ferrous iron transport protein B
MGLLPGTEVQLVRRSALGDPIEVALRQYHLSVRLTEGEAIEILELGDAPMPTPTEPEACPAPPSRPPRDRSEAFPTILLAGNPNAGKTTVFNALTGSRARVGNYPGVTVERRVGKVEVGGTTIDLVDLPGTYSLSARSPEEQVAVEALLGHNGPRPDAVVLVVDSGALVRNLYLALQVIEAGLPVVLALNMMDEVEARGQSIDDTRLARELGCEVVPLIARTGYGLDRLLVAVGNVLARDHAPETVELPLSEASRSDLARVVDVAAQAEPEGTPAEHHARARWAVLSLGDDELVDVPAGLREAARAAREAAAADGRDLIQDLVQARYAYLEPRVAACLEGGPGHGFQSWTDRIDSVLTHRVWGSLAFALVMAGLFQLLFQGCDPLVGAIEGGVAGIQGWLSAVLGPGLLTSLLVDGVVAGVGNVVVFAPQIAALFLLIGFLEDCGYLARVAFLIDRVMGGVGLHGKAFVPMLSGFACAIPAAMATRTIESRLDRLAPPACRCTC